MKIFWIKLWFSHILMLIMIIENFRHERKIFRPKPCLMGAEYEIYQ